MDNFKGKNKDVIIKSNVLIDSGYKLTLQEQRIVNIACNKLIPMFVKKNISIEEFSRLAQTMAFELIEISVADYLGVYKTKSKAIYKELEKVATSLYEKEIVYFDEDSNLTRKRWVITCKYKDNEGKIALRFHPDLIKDLLIFQSNFTNLNYNVLTNVKSFYASRMYELLRQHMFVGKRKFELQDLRFKLGLDDNEYPKYANLKQKVIKPSIKWINDNSDIEVEIEEDKCGTRSVQKLTFKINSKEVVPITCPSQLSLPIESDNSLYQNIKSILNIDITAEQVDILSKSAVEGVTKYNIKKGCLDYIKEKWVIAKAYADRSVNPNYIGALKKALEENWKDNLVLENNTPKLKFDNFNGREYSSEEWDSIEQGLLDASIGNYV